MASAAAPAADSACASAGFCDTLARCMLLETLLRLLPTLMLLLPTLMLLLVLAPPSRTPALGGSMETVGTSILYEHSTLVVRKFRDVLATGFIPPTTCCRPLPDSSWWQTVCFKHFPVGHEPGEPAPRMRPANALLVVPDLQRIILKFSETELFIELYAMFRILVPERNPGCKLLHFAIRHTREGCSVYLHSAQLKLRHS
mmetsp:Transcript_28341/g.54002  ORF Transcript_28341/g.54002 Transcript_28341/m.54002 type:complete len:200 (-) Transcript_28341:121-720(-)